MFAEHCVTRPYFLPAESIRHGIIPTKEKPMLAAHDTGKTHEAALQNPMEADGLDHVG
jgi:hypothetical protein